MNFLGNSNSFINRSLDLHERGLGLLVKLATFLDGGNASICSKEDGDWINFRFLSLLLAVGDLVPQPFMQEIPNAIHHHLACHQHPSKLQTAGQPITDDEREDAYRYPP